MTLELAWKKKREMLVKLLFDQWKWIEAEWQKFYLLPLLLHHYVSGGVSCQGLLRYFGSTPFVGVVALVLASADIG